MHHSAAPLGVGELKVAFTSTILTNYPELADMSPAEREAIVIPAVRALLEDLLERPPWSDRWHICPDARAKGGVGAAMFAPTADGDIEVVLMHPNRKNRRKLLQAPGGHIHFFERETLEAALAREISEELVYPDGESVLEEDLQDRFFLLDGKSVYPEGFAISVYGFGIEITQNEMAAIKELQATIEDSDATRSAFTMATKDEIYGIQVKRLSHVLQDPYILNHPDQGTLFYKLAQKLDRDGRYEMPDMSKRRPAGYEKKH